MTALNEFIGAVLQIIAFSFIPFLVYVIGKKKKKVKGFFEYIGLKKSNRKANWLALLIALLLAGPVILLSVFNPEFKAILTHPDSVTGNIRELGFSAEAVLIVLITALLKTGLSEEIFFRGFLAKRLIAGVGFQTGNMLQAVIFGIIHTLLFLTISKNPLFLFVIFLFPALGAYFKVILNEKMADGSIVPGWIAHGVGNVLAYSVIGFLI
jgi:membrane protease YdiL (CAAX protease family)